MIGFKLICQLATLSRTSFFQTTGCQPAFCSLCWDVFVYWVAPFTCQGRPRFGSLSKCHIPDCTVFSWSSLQGSASMWTIFNCPSLLVFSHYSADSALGYPESPGNIWLTGTGSRHANNLPPDTFWNVSLSVLRHSCDFKTQDLGRTGAIQTWHF